MTTLDYSDNLLQRARPGADDGAARPGSEPVKLDIEIVSDAICPWCWVGKRRLEKALATLQPELTANVTWRPYELNADMPKDGLDRRAYRSHKFGSWEHSQALDAQVKVTAAADGLDFRHDLMERTPNTRDAHRLIWLAGREGVQDAVVEGLFSAYFHEGRDVGLFEVLVEVGTVAGLAPERVFAMLRSSEGEEEIAAELDRAARLNIRSVPTVLVNGRALFSGAIPAQAIAAHLLQAARHAS